MWAAGAFRGSPASTTITERRWRPSWRAAASPAADPPTTATSQCRSTVRGAWSAHGSTIRSIAGSCKVPCGIRKTTGGGADGRGRTRSSRWCAPGCAACGTRWACRSTSSPPAPTSARPPSAGSRPASGRSASTSCSRSPPRSRSTSTRCSTCAATTTWSSARRRARAGGRTTWMLSRPTGNTIAIKMRLEPTDRPPEQRVHPGHDWFFVIEGRVRLLLGEREIIVETGEAAEFATMTPHAVRRHRRPGRAHHDLRPRRPARPRPPRAAGLASGAGWSRLG